MYGVRPGGRLRGVWASARRVSGFLGFENMSEDFIDVYGGYAIKLLKLQNELLQTLDRYRRGRHQTVEVHHVHLYPGSQGVIGVVNQAQDGRKDHILPGARGVGGVINSATENSAGAEGEK
jgi:hypothetical protein